MSRSSHSFQFEQIAIRNCEAIHQIQLGDYDGALTSFHKAFLLSTNHATFKNSNVGDDGNIVGSINIVEVSDYGIHHSPSEKFRERECYVDLHCDADSANINNSTAEKIQNDGQRNFNHQVELDEGMCLFKKLLHIPNAEILDEEVVQATLLYNIAILHSRRKEEEESELHFSKVLSILKKRRSTFERHDDDFDSNTTNFQGPTLLQVLHNIGHAQFQSCKYEDAVRSYQKVLRNTSLFCESEHVSNSDKFFNLDVSNALNCLGVALSYMAIGQETLKETDECLEKAIESFTQALLIRETLMGHRHTLEIATIMNNLGRVKFLEGSFVEAEMLYEEAYHIRSEFLEEMHMDIAAVLHNIGQVQYQFGNLQTSLDHYHDCLDILSIKIGKGHPKVTHLLLEIGDMYMEDERFNLAIEYYTQALSGCCSRITSRYDEESFKYWPCSGTLSLIKKKLEDCKGKRIHSLVHKQDDVNSAPKTISHQTITIR